MDIVGVSGTGALHELQKGMRSLKGLGALLVVSQRSKKMRMEGNYLP